MVTKQKTGESGDRWGKDTGVFYSRVEGEIDVTNPDSIMEANPKELYKENEWGIPAFFFNHLSMKSWPTANIFKDREVFNHCQPQKYISQTNLRHSQPQDRVKL